MGEDQRNFFIAAGLIIVIFLMYDVFVVRPGQEAREAERQAAIEAAGELADPDLPVAPNEPAAPVFESRDAALDNVTRVEIDGPSVIGSISLTGARFDDIRLVRHTTTVDDATPVALLNPIGTEHVFYARDGWQSATPGFNDLPGGSTEWTLVSGSTLTPDSPVVLAYDSPSGLRFERTISVDENYLFTLEDTVTNNAGSEVELSRYGLVRQEGMPEELVNNIAVFEGAIAVVNGSTEQIKFSKLEDGEEMEEL